MFSLTEAVPVLVLPEPEPWLKPVEVEVALLDDAVVDELLESPAP